MSELQDFKDAVSRLAHGMTAAEAKAANICIKCRETPVFITPAGKREYQITGLCEPCWDEIVRDE